MSAKAAWLQRSEFELSKKEAVSVLDSVLPPELRLGPGEDSVNSWHSGCD